MKALEVLEKTADYAKKYRSEAQQSLERNNHMNQIEDGEQVQQRIIDAVLVDFINYIGVKHGIDFGMYTKDLM
jgi:hypothetical protein